MSWFVKEGPWGYYPPQKNLFLDFDFDKLEKEIAARMKETTKDNTMYTVIKLPSSVFMGSFAAEADAIRSAENCAAANPGVEYIVTKKVAMVSIPKAKPTTVRY